MGELIFIGLGLYDDMDTSLRGIEAIKSSDFIYAEFYTSLMSGFSVERFMRTVGRKVSVLSRKDLEDDKGELILQKAAKGKVALLVPGDPLIATTHIDLRIRAKKRGIKTRIIHGASIMSAAIGLSGLQNYRFGKSVTVPFSDCGRVPETPYDVIAQNKMRDLHTLCFLDIKVEEGRYMTINESLEILLLLENKIRGNIVTPESLAVGIARAGSEDVVVKAGYIKDLVNYNFGGLPHSLIIPANKLHFMEAEALISLAGAPNEVKEMVK